MEWIADPQIWASLVTLTVMEIVLGIDNIVFISVLVSRLPASSADSARRIGLSLALVLRILLLLVISWIIGLTAPLFTVFGEAFSWRDMILLAGGAFLLFKGTLEIHSGIEGEEDEHGAQPKHPAFWSVIVQILLIDLVFSVDSIVTAVGMAEHVEVMIAAVVISIGIMFVASGPVAAFIKEHPTTKMLALSFLLLIGVALIADGLGFHIPRAYIYFAMAFSALVEVLNIMRHRKRKAMHVENQN
ncbi:TerC family protein [Amorphus sp. 3PC139-8]|uniref:TerC family protein n=1 Tax=Amorphus sp. 3PC139-8 TaxID=2735676 RepID=UPI00345D1EE3